MTAYKRCVFFLLDGSRPDVIGNLLMDGQLPNFYDIFVKQGVFTRATTVFPSTTGAAYLPYLTGFYPGHCNIPGIRWFDRKRYSKDSGFSLKRFRSYVGIESYLFNRDLSPRVKTLFEHARRPMNVFNTINRGSGFWGDRTRFQRSLYSVYAHYTQRWEFVDRWVGRQTRSALKKRPDFLFSAFPAIDEMSHRTNPFSKAVIQAYQQFDAELGKIRSQMEKQGMWDETLFVLASDHGMTATHTHFDLIKFMEGEGYQTFYYPRIFKKNFNLAVMQSGNAMAHIYIKGQMGWEHRNEKDDLEVLMDRLSRRKEIAWVATLDKEGGVYVRGGSCEAWIRENDHRIHYKTKGGDPFGFKNLKSSMTDQEGLEISFDQKYPDAFRQLLQLFTSERTGDLVVNAAPGYDLRLMHEWPEHFSSHGSLIQEHMHVPFACSHPIPLRRKVRSADVFPTILTLLGLPLEGPYDGISLIV